MTVLSQFFVAGLCEAGSSIAIANTSGVTDPGYRNPTG